MSGVVRPVSGARHRRCDRPVADRRLTAWTMSKPDVCRGRADLRARNEPVVPVHYTNRFVIVRQRGEILRGGGGAARLVRDGWRGRLARVQPRLGDRAALLGGTRRGWQNAESERLLDRATALPFTVSAVPHSYRTGGLTCSRHSPATALWSGRKPTDAASRAGAGSCGSACSGERTILGCWRRASLRDLGRILEARPSDASLHALQDALAEEDRDSFIEESARETRAEIIAGFWNARAVGHWRTARASGPWNRLRFISRPGRARYRRDGG